MTIMRCFPGQSGQRQGKVFLVYGRATVQSKAIQAWRYLFHHSNHRLHITQGWKSEKSVEKYFVVRSIILAKEVLFWG